MSHFCKAVGGAFHVNENREKKMETEESIRGNRRVLNECCKASVIQI